MKVEFTIPGEPKGKGRPRFSTKSGSAYTPQATVSYENLVKVEYQRQLGNKRFEDGKPLKMTIYANYPVPKSTSKSKSVQMLHGIIRPTKKPDMDNIAKIIADSLNQIAYRDDAQIVELFINKGYAAIPQVQVSIEEINI